MTPDEFQKEMQIFWKAVPEYERKHFHRQLRRAFDQGDRCDKIVTVLAGDL